MADYRRSVKKVKRRMAFEVREEAIVRNIMKEILKRIMMPLNFGRWRIYVHVSIGAGGVWTFVCR